MYFAEKTTPSVFKHTWTVYTFLAVSDAIQGHRALVNLWSMNRPWTIWKCSDSCDWTPCLCFRSRTCTSPWMWSSLKLTNFLPNSSQTRKVAELIVAAVLQGLKLMMMLQSYTLLKTSQSATATKGARPILICFGGSPTFTRNSLYSEFKSATLKLNRVFYSCFLCADSL